MVERSPGARAGVSLLVASLLVTSSACTRSSSSPSDDDATAASIVPTASPASTASRARDAGVATLGRSRGLDLGGDRGRDVDGGPVDPPDPVPAGAGTEDDLRAVTRGDAAFATRLLAQLSPGKNVFFSPASLRMALALALTGAAGETARELASTLALDSDVKRDAHGYAALLRNLSPTSPASADRLHPRAPTPTLHIANALWGQKASALVPDYAATLKIDYAAPYVSLDFAGDPVGSRKKINDAVALQTHDKIKELVGPGSITAATRLVLTDAVYFRGAWANVFAAADTTDGTFFTGASSSVTTRLMSQVDQLAIKQTGGVTVVSLPYAGARGRFSLLLVIPDDKNGLAALEHGLTETSLPLLLTGLTPQRVHLTMPRFRESGTFSLSGVLTTLGVHQAFSAAADFSGIDGAHDLFLSEVIHQAYISVDEQGTEAAAATMVGMVGTGAAPLATPIEVRADRPFLYFLRDSPTGTLLFVGRLVDPR